VSVIVRGRRQAAAILLAAVTAVTAACTGPSRAAAFAPTFTRTRCPAVQDFVVLKMTCGYLTVLENRNRPAGRTIRLFVTRIEPPQRTRKPDPMFVGVDLAVVPDYAGIAPMAQRLDREVITMDPRGVGHSRPSLACPEVERLSRSSLGVPTGDRAMRSSFLTAVAACYHRLRKQGIDLSSYDLQQSAADIEDLRTALRIKQWGLTATGTESRVILQAVRDYPEHVREVLLDGADFPQADPFSEAIRSTRYAIGQMDAACSADPACNRRFPHFARAVSTVVSRLTRNPVTVTVPAASGQPPVRILFDGALFLRSLRDLLAYIPRDGVGPQIPASIYRVLGSGASSSLEPIAARMATDQTYCVGYQPKCDNLHPLTEGAYYSILCSDIQPFTDLPGLAQLAGHEPGYAEAFVHDPYLDVCARWKVRRAEPSVASPVRTDVPTLMFAGQFDPFGALPVAKRAATTFGRAWVYGVPGIGHNVFGVDICSRSIRTAWVDNPTSPPASIGCLSALHYDAGRFRAVAPPPSRRDIHREHRGRRDAVGELVLVAAENNGEDDPAEGVERWNCRLDAKPCARAVAAGRLRSSEPPHLRDCPPGRRQARGRPYRRLSEPVAVYAALDQDICGVDM
jgi:pimeloyl-ACP methyl ester carboxylesterase